MGNIYEDYEPPKGEGGLYYKPEDGVMKRFRIMSEPVVYNSSFEKDGKTTVSTKYAFIMFNLDDEVAQVVSLPVTAFRQIIDLGRDDDWGDPLENTYDVKIKRTGKSKDTVWSINPGKAKGELTEEQKLEVEGINLISAVEAGKGASGVQWLSDVIQNGRTTDNSSRKSKDDVAIENPGDEPINLDDIPF